MASYVSSNDDKYWSTVQAYQNQANALNAIYSNNNDQYQSVINANKSIGESDRKALEQKFTRDKASAAQDMLSRGMSNSSVFRSSQRGINYDQANATTVLNDALARRQQALELEQIGARERYGAGLSNIMGQRSNFEGNRYSQFEQGAMNDFYQRGLMDQQAKIQEKRDRLLHGWAVGGGGNGMSRGAMLPGAAEMQDANERLRAGQYGAQAASALAATPLASPAFSGVSGAQTVHIPSPAAGVSGGFGYGGGYSPDGGFGIGSPYEMPSGTSGGIGGPSFNFGGMTGQLNGPYSNFSMAGVGAGGDYYDQ